MAAVTTAPPPGVAAAAATTVLLLNTAWHGSAAYYFMFKARGMLRKFMTPRMFQTSPNGAALVPEAAIHMSRYLGAINTAFSFLAFYNLVRYLLRKKVSLGAVCTLAIVHLSSKSNIVAKLTKHRQANFSQFVYDVVVHYKDAAKIDILQLTILDGLMSVFNLLLAYHIIQASKPVNLIASK